MSLGAQFTRLLTKTAATRQEMFGRSADGTPQLGVYDNQDPATAFELYYTPVRTQQQLDESGFTQVHDTIIRFAKAAGNAPAAPKIGKNITLLDLPQGNLTVRIAEFGNSGINPEWVLGCTNI